MGSLSRFNLKELQSEYPFDTFVESGTMRGHGITHALNHGIKTIHSIEISHDLYFSSKLYFSEYSNVFIHLGSSQDVLPPLLDFLASSKSIFFWLDAHFNYSLSGFQSYDSPCESSDKNTDSVPPIPLVNELKTIFEKRPFCKDIILIDDLACLMDNPLIHDQNTSTKNLEKQGILREGFSKKDLFGIDINDLLEVIPHTHQATAFGEDQGFLMIRPNKP